MISPVRRPYTLHLGPSQETLQSAVLAAAEAVTSAEAEVSWDWSIGHNTPLLLTLKKWFGLDFTWRLLLRESEFPGKCLINQNLEKGQFADDD